MNVTSQLVVGLSYGSKDGKSFFAWPEQLGEAWSRLANLGGPALPRGAMYWNIDLEGDHGNCSDANPQLYMARELNKFLGTRSTEAAGSPPVDDSRDL